MRLRTDEHAGLGAVTATFAAMLLCANIATPLYPSYSTKFGFSPAVLSLIFATYAIVLLPSLLVFGQLSDRFGRRPLIGAGLGVTVLACITFAVAQSAAYLFAARALLGLAQGLLSGAATAALVELAGERAARPAALRATVAQAAGSAVGPAMAGAVAQWLPGQYVSPYVIGGVIAIAAGLGLLRVTETMDSPRNGGLRIQRPSVPAEIRSAFVRVSVTAAAAWAVAASLFLAIVPSFASAVFGTTNLAVLGATAGLMLAASAVTQLAARRGVAPRIAQAGGLALLAVGLGLLVLTHVLGVPALLLVGAAIAGVGHGLAALAAQENLTQIAPGEQRGEISAAFYVVLYCGVAVPAIGLGVIASLTSLFTAVDVFAAVTGTTAIAVAVWHLTSGDA